MNTLLPEDWRARLTKEIQDTPLAFSCSGSLGIRKMPDGYALMWSESCEHYYGLRWDGLESNMDCRKWAVYRWAMADAPKFGPEPPL